MADLILRDTQSVITLVNTDEDGDPRDADAGQQVKATATDSGGTALFTDRVAVSQGVGTGKYDITLAPTETAVLDVYDVVWSITVGAAAQKRRTRFEVVESFLFTIAELRDFDADLTEAKHPREKVVTAREIAEERIEELCGVAWRRRGHREFLDGPGGKALIVSKLKPVKVVAAKIDGVALTADELAELKIHDPGIIERPTGKIWTCGQRNIEIHYEHGFAAAPEPIRRAALILARAALVKSPLPSDAVMTYSDENATYRLAVAGRDGPTGIPDVDAVIAQFGYASMVGH